MEEKHYAGPKKALISHAPSLPISQREKGVKEWRRDASGRLYPVK